MCCWTCEGLCLESPCSFVCLVFGGESALSPCNRERSYAQIDRANFGVTQSWACARHVVCF